MGTRFLTAVIALVSCLHAKAQIYDTNGEYVETFAGSGESGLVNGQGVLTKFNNPSLIVADSSSNLYVWDSGNYLVRKITPSGAVSTFAGGGSDVEGWGTNVSFSFYGGISGMAVDQSNMIWLVAGNDSYLLNMATNGYITIQNGGPGLTNLSPNICFDSANNIYYAGGNIVWRYNPATGISQPFAGNGTSGYLDGNGTVFPEFSCNSAPITCDDAGSIYVWDFGNYVIRRIDQNQNVTTIAGKGYGVFQNVDGTGTNAAFAGITQLFSDNAGDIYLCNGNCIRKMNAQTNVVTMAGSFSSSGYNNAPGNAALFNGAKSACLSQGMIFVADSINQRIRSITFNAMAQTVSPANLQLNSYPGLVITGTVGRTYQIQSSPNMTTWTTEATVLLTSSSYLWIDQNPIRGNKFYRALLMP
jgi:hypothetical protein